MSQLSSSRHGWVILKYGPVFVPNSFIIREKDGNPRNSGSFLQETISVEIKSHDQAILLTSSTTWRLCYQRQSYSGTSTGSSSCWWSYYWFGVGSWKMWRRWTLFVCPVLITASQQGASLKMASRTNFNLVKRSEFKELPQINHTCCAVCCL